MKMNDADYFSWVAKHLYGIHFGFSDISLNYIDEKGYYKTYIYDYAMNNITLGAIDDSELLRRIIDKIIESETGK